MKRLATSAAFGFQLSVLAASGAFLAATDVHADSYAEASNRYFDKEDPSVSKLDSLYLQSSCTQDFTATYIFRDHRSKIEVRCSSVAVREYRVNIFGGGPILDQKAEGYDRKTFLSLYRSESLHYNVNQVTSFQLHKLIEFQGFDTILLKPVKTKAVYFELLQIGSGRAAGSQTEECLVSSQDRSSIGIDCKVTYRNYNNGGGIASGETLRSTRLYWKKELNTFLPADFVTESPVDALIGNGPWHSQTVSAELTSEQKAKAQSLFAAGFDLYKGGDFVGAQTLINKGLETDPANVLAWFTLGEINRAAWKTKGDQEAAKAGYYDYLRVIDLAPADSTQALLATNYLKEGGMN